MDFPDSTLSRFGAHKFPNTNITKNVFPGDYLQMSRVGKVKRLLKNSSIVLFYSFAYRKHTPKNYPSINHLSIPLDRSPSPSLIIRWKWKSIGKFVVKLIGNHCPFLMVLRCLHIASHLPQFSEWVNKSDGSDKWTLVWKGSEKDSKPTPERVHFIVGLMDSKAFVRVFNCYTGEPLS